MNLSVIRVAFSLGKMPPEKMSWKNVPPGNLSPGNLPLRKLPTGSWSPENCPSENGAL